MNFVITHFYALHVSYDILCPSLTGELYLVDRLRTILSYDRILVLDAGRVAVSTLTAFWSNPQTDKMTGVRCTRDSFQEKRWYISQSLRKE